MNALAGHPNSKRRLDLILTVVSGLFVFGVYALTLSPSFFPGQSAALAATAAGVVPPILPEHPVWSAVMGWLAGVGGLTMAVRLNLFSALCGAVSAALMFRLMSELVYRAIDQQINTAKHAVRASLLAGLMAVAAMAFSMPLWTSSTRLHFQTFDLLWILALAHLAMVHLRTGSLACLALLAFLFGVGIVETPVLIPLAPVFAVWLLYGWLQAGRIRGERLALAVVCGLAGLSLFWVVAWRFAAVYDLSSHGYQSVWNVVRSMLRGHYYWLRGSVPRVGWLWTVLLAFVPWITVQLTASRALNDTREWSYYLLHLALTVFTVAMLANVPVSPWGMLAPGGQIPAVSYAMSAMAAGYLVAYWYLLLANRVLARVRDLRLLRVRMGTWLGYALTVPLMVVICAAAVINGFQASGRRGAFADECARSLLDSLGSRRWIISDGLLDAHLLLEAHRRDSDIRLIALQRNDNPVYIRQLRQMIDLEPEFAQLNRVRLKNAADLGVLAFVQDWLAADERIAGQVAVISAPDLLVGAGLTVVPNGLCFVGVRDRATLKNEPYLEQYGPFWDHMDKLLPRAPKTRDPVAAYRHQLRRQVGFVANNLGVLLEDLERPDDAYVVYRRVRQLDPENASSLLNLVEMVSRGYKPEAKAALEKELKTFVDNLSGRLPIWSLSRYYGYVRSPRLFAQLGWTWAMSGQPGLAMSGISRALEIAPSASRTQLRQAMASILLQQDDEEKSEAIYDEILQSEPANRRALVGKARIASRQGALDRAREWLEKAQSAGVDRTRLAIEWASVYLASGEAEKARIALTEVTELQPKNLQAWGLLAVALLQLNETDDVQKRVLPKMESLAGGPDHFLVQVTRGQLAYRRGPDGYPAAREAFERAYALRSSVPVLLEWILRLDFMMNDKRRGEIHARQLLRVNRDNSFANYIMGSIMMDYGRTAEAEDYLRRSVGSTRTAASLNDLAELLRQTGKFKEAEDYARAAIDLKPDLYVAWDTLAGVLTATKRFDEAEEAYNKALATFADDLRVHLNLANLLRQKGEIVRAREIVARLLPRKMELPEQNRTDLEALARELSARM